MAKARLIVTPWQAACRAGFGWAMGNASANIDTGDTIIMVRNDNESRPFYIQAIGAGTEDKGEVVVHRVTAAYTAAGTAIVPVNMRAGFKTQVSELTCFGDETGNTRGDIIAKFGLSSVTTDENRDSRELVFDGGLILDPGQALGLDIVGEPELVHGYIWGYFELEDAS